MSSPTTATPPSAGLAALSALASSIGLGSGSGSSGHSGAGHANAGTGSGSTPSSPTGHGPGHAGHHPPSKPVNEFLELNVRHVFENTTIEKTMEIHKKLGVEIERKKEEMRVLVGERYRDLIDAADTIGTMRTDSHDIFNKLVNLRTKLSTFPVLSKTWTEAGAGDADGADNKSRVLKSTELEIACKLKLSQEIPRQVQIQLKRQNLPSALHYYLLYAKKVKDVLVQYKWTFLQGRGQDAAGVDAAMKASILAASNEAMEEFETSAEKLTECMIIKTVLNACSSEITLKEFLETRIQHCQKILNEASEGDDEGQQQKLIQYISRTLLAIFQIFIEPEIYNNTSKQIRQPSISAATLGISAHVPKSIVEFNNERIFIEEPPRIGKLTELVLQHYIPALKTLLQESYGSQVFLHGFNSLKELMEFKQSSFTLLQTECDNFGRILFGSHLKTIWSEVFQSIFQLRCQAVVQARVDDVFKIFSVTDATGIYSRSRAAEAGFDLVNFLWRQSETSTTPGSPQSQVAPDMADLELLKLKCFTPNIAAVCAELETAIGALLNDFKSMNNTSTTALDSATANTGPAILREFMSATILAGFQQLLASTEDNALFLARVLTAIIDLCPTLWKVVEKNDAVTLRQIFWSRSELCWNAWSEEMLTEFGAHMKARIPALSPDIVIELMPVGEVFKPSMGAPTGDEPGQIRPDFEPSIRVPIQLSHVLHSMLFKLCLQLANVGPQSMPKPVRDSIRQSLGQSVIGFYDQVVTSAGNAPASSEDAETPTSSAISAQVAIQFIFDLKFVQWFHPKLGGGGQIEGLLSRLQGFIDPFDWDIVSSRLNLNLKRFLFENHLTLGLLFSEESHTFIAQNFKTKQNQSYPIANRGLLAPLPLLPI